ncbi:hypothetical protein [Massilia scottii]|uniref:hypothetical protein n=1 Tax=Massilia scottii TaxID=3057166 RepID=UPI002796B257|nr:hypothetical protein [Massilia sp. CCM 9029]MDQ1829735.1 hypothetical protein [Massilia sp. CCM 9029]
MSTSSTEHYPQDDLSGVLATPAGTDGLAPLRPDPLPAVVVAAPAMPAAGSGAQPAEPERAGRVLQVVVGATLLACAGAGLFAWLG